MGQSGDSRQRGLMTLRPTPIEEWTERDLTANIKLVEAQLADLYRRRAGLPAEDGAGWCARCGRTRVSVRDGICPECESA